MFGFTGTDVSVIKAAKLFRGIFFPLTFAPGRAYFVVQTEIFKPSLIIHIFD